MSADTTADTTTGALEGATGAAKAETVIATSDLDLSGREVSASTIGRMMGLATISELKLLEGKIDLLATKLTNISVRFDKLLSMAANFPSGNDFERIEVQIGSLKLLIREALGDKVSSASEGDSGDTMKKIRSKIFSNTTTTAAAPATAAPAASAGEGEPTS